MAKLSAHGTELARLTIYRPQSAPEYESDATTGYTATYSVRSDGHILQKLKAHGLHQRSHDLYGGNPDYTSPWKLWKKTKDRRLPASEIARIAGRLFSRIIVDGTAELKGPYAADMVHYAEAKQGFSHSTGEMA